MKRLNRYISILMAMMLTVGIIGVKRVDASGSLNVRNVRQTKSELQTGDSFGIIVTTGYKADQIELISADFGSAADTVDTGNYDNKVSLASSPEADGNESQFYIGGLTYVGKGGNTGISFNVTYKLTGNDTEETAKISYTIKAEAVSDGTGELRLKDVPKISVKAGETQTVDLTIYNAGSSTVKSPIVDVELSGEKTDGITIKDGKGIKVSSISPKSTSKISFKIESSKVASPGKYNLKVNLAGDTEMVPFTLTSDFMPPQLQFAVENQQEMVPGKTQDLIIKVKNVGDSEAKEVKVELENKENLAIMGGSNVKYIPKIPAKQSVTVTYKVNIGTGVKQNIMPVKINYAYKDIIGEGNEDKEQYVYLPIKGGSSATGEVVVQNIIAPSGTLGVDKSFNVKFTLAALQGNAKNVKISVSAEDPATIVPRSQNLFMVPELKKGSKQQYSVTMSATAKATSQSHPIKIEVSYDSIGEEPVVFTQYTSVNIFNPEAEKKEEDEEDAKKRKPKVIIGEYTITPNIVEAGKEFDLAIGFLNTNSSKSVHNLKANLTVREQGENDAGNVFTPVNASNTFYISSLSPGQTVMKNITMYTIPNANPKTYQVQLELEYEDDNGNPIEAVESIGIPVEQTTKVDISEIEFDMMQVGVPMPVNINLYNTGKTNISNMMIYTEGEGFSVQENKMFLGSFEKGSSEYYSPTIVPEQPGLLKGAVIIEYEEATGEIVKISKDFEFEAMEMQIDDMDYMDFPVEEEKKKKWPMVLGVIVGIAAAIAIVQIIRKKRKNKKDLEFDLDE